MKITVRDNRTKNESSSGFEQEESNDCTGFRKRCYTVRQTLLVCIAKIDEKREDE